METILGLQSKISSQFALNFKLSKQHALLLCFGITILAMIAEFVASYFTGSLMLFSDGIHMLSHAASLFVSWLAIYVASKFSSKKFPFGLKRLEVLAAFVNGLSLLFFVAYIIYSGIVRLLDPQAIEVGMTLSVAFIGLAINLLTAFILGLAGLEDLNTRSAFMHMLADTFSSIAIILGAVIIHYTGWFQVDAILSFVVAIVIAKWSFGLLKESGKILLESSPESIKHDAIASDLYGRFDTIVSVDEVKVWQIGEKEIAANLLLKVYPAETYEYKYMKREIRKRIEKKFGITQVSIEMDW